MSLQVYELRLYKLNMTFVNPKKLFNIVGDALFAILTSAQSWVIEAVRYAIN